jgi:LacI family transcriptional regulator
MGLSTFDSGQVLTLLDGAGLPPVTAPRPYFHPVRSLAGTVLTAVAPADHPHHLGLSIAFSDLNGTNFWGGSTYMPGRGPVVLPNHGRQLMEAWTEDGGQQTASVLWQSEHGKPVAEERRTVACFPHPARGTWCLSLTSVMVPACGVGTLEVSSSAVKGRAGAGYGGIFWRFPADGADPDVFSAAGRGAGAAHGSGSPWLSLSVSTGGAQAAVVMAQGGPVRPWFIRTEGYVGAGPAVAWSEKAVADAAHPLRQSLHAVIHDGPVTSPEQALELLENHPGFPDRTS